MSLLFELFPYFCHSIVNSEELPRWKAVKSCYLIVSNMVQKHKEYTSKKIISFLAGLGLLLFFLKAKIIFLTPMKTALFLFFKQIYKQKNGTICILEKIYWNWGSSPSRSKVLLGKSKLKIWDHRFPIKPVSEGQRIWKEENLIY